MSFLRSTLQMAACLAVWPVLGSTAAHAAVPALTLVHEIRFSQGADSAQGATGTLHGQAVVAGGVLSLSGPSAFVDYSALIPSAENGANTWWSVSLWARQAPGTGGSTAAVMVGQGPDFGYLPEFSLELRPAPAGGREVAGLNQSGWGGGISAAVADAGGWHHYAVAMAENVALLWVDGQYIGQGAAGWDYSTPYFHGSTRLGRQVKDFGGQFNGELDDLRIYSGRFDDATVQAQALSGPSVSAVPEPSSALLALLGGAALLTWRRRTAR